MPAEPTTASPLLAHVSAVAARKAQIDQHAAQERRRRAAALAAANGDGWRWQHGQRPAYGAQTRVAPGLEALRKSGDITDAHVAAAERWTTDYLFGVIGARDPERASSGGSDPGHDAAAVARAQAIGNCRQVADILGGGTEAWLVALLVDELSFSAMAARFMPERASSDARSRVAALQARNLECLASTYAYLDRKKPSHPAK